MSKARRISDVERTTTMLGLLHRRHGCDPSADMPPSHVVIEEVAPSTGFRGANRYADALALGCWHSKGYELDGYEVKASRADLKRELADPSKHEALARYCHRWWLVVWDESILLDGIPETWGILATRGSDDDRELYQVRAAKKREPDAWPPQFVASMVRNAFQQSPGAMLLARAIHEASKRSIAEGKKYGEDKVRRQWDEALAPLRKRLYGDSSWRWPAEAHDPTKLVAAILAQLDAPPLPLTTEKIA